MRGFPPIGYNLRSLWVRRSATALTVVGIGATVAVLAGILALQQGFASLYEQGGRPDVVLFLRPGATSEGESGLRRETVAELKKGLAEVARDAEGRPLASGELYLAVRRRKLDGGETNVPIRGVEQESFAIAGDKLKIVEGRSFQPGTDEVIVGRALTGRIQDCQLGSTIVFNTTPFKVVGVFDYDGPFRSEVWGDAVRMGEALERASFSRVIAKLNPGVDVKQLAARMETDKRTPTKVLDERSYLRNQTKALSFTLWLLGAFLAVIMGTAAVFTGTNTMLAAIAARSHEIGILLAIGFRPLPVFLSFMFEALALGLLGGAVGCLLVLPLHGLDTGTTNFQTFTEVAFAFRVTPQVLEISVLFACGLGLLGGIFPAWSAAMKDPVEALRRT
ncbi:MAG: ABC transporter permease [Planctomycetota bacterium]